MALDITTRVVSLLSVQGKYMPASLNIQVLSAQVFSGVSKANCRKIVDRYKGTELDEFVLWRMEVGAHNTKTLSKLKLGG